MARIKRVSADQAGPYVKIAYYFTRRSIAKLTGRETERMIEPLQMYAHLPVLFKGEPRALPDRTANSPWPWLTGAVTGVARLLGPDAMPRSGADGRPHSQVPRTWWRG